MACVVDVDEGEVAALVGQVAEPVFVDILEDACEDSCDIGQVFLMVVDDVVCLFKPLEEMGDF